MKALILGLVLGLYGLLSFSQENKRFFFNINGTLGRHTVVFKDYAASSGLSFGYAVNCGIYAVNKKRYSGGLSFSIMEAASRDVNRRALSENFILPDSAFDQHIIFNFAQFRRGNMGWFSELDLHPQVSVYHQMGFGIFGTTEKDQLLDFGMNQQLGVYLGDKNRFRFRLGVDFDTTFGTGNPNYLQRNTGFSIGGTRSF